MSAVLVDDAPQYLLRIRCLACNREPGEAACLLCRKMEYATRAVEGRASPELDEVPAKSVPSP